LFACGTWNLTNQRPSLACDTIASLRADLDALAPYITPGVTPVVDIVGMGRALHELRAEVARLLPVVEAARHWREWEFPGLAKADELLPSDHTLVAAVDALTTTPEETR